MNTIEIGKRIKIARTMRNVTLEDIANDIGVARSTIQRYEKGTIVTPKIPVLHAISKSLNINPAWLVLKSDKMILEDIAEHTLTDEELSHLTNYRKLDIEEKKTIDTFVELCHNHPDYVVALSSNLELLNDNGKSEAIKRINELTFIETYQTEDYKKKCEHLMSYYNALKSTQLNEGDKV